MEIVRELPAGSTAAAPRFWKRAILGRLAPLSGGQLRITDRHGSTVVGTAGDLHARVTIQRDRVWRRVALGGSEGVWTSYVDGDWDADDLTAVVRLFSRNRRNLYALDGGLARATRPLARAAAWLDRNTRAGARRNIAAHYDLGNEFFALMLDPTMTYSAGVFERPGTSLEDASLAKIDRLCRKLQLTSADHLLEIGTGWGAFAIHAARRYGCRVMTSTLSQQQYEWATRRVAEARLTDRVTVLHRDYRDIEGTFTKLVSVEMIEAVGAEYLPAFFHACAARLVPGGLMALQAITVADQQFEAARRDGTDFIKRCVFPGSCIPSIAALLDAARDASDFRLLHLEDLTEHYPPTLAAWRENLRLNDAAVQAMTSARFRRIWNFYLAYCEGGFLERHTGLVQMLFVRPQEV